MNETCSVPMAIDSYQFPGVVTGWKVGVIQISFMPLHEWKYQYLEVLQVRFRMRTTAALKRS